MVGLVRVAALVASFSAPSVAANPKHLLFVVVDDLGFDVREVHAPHTRALMHARTIALQELSIAHTQAN